LNAPTGEYDDGIFHRRPSGAIDQRPTDNRDGTRLRKQFGPNTKQKHSDKYQPLPHRLTPKTV
jgi:hypothetical protein